MQEFKVGDWVYSTREYSRYDDKPGQITSIENNGDCYIENKGGAGGWEFSPSELKHWQPKVGELFWGTRELHTDYQYETRTELFQVKHIQDDGTLSLISPLDRNVYSLWIQPEDLQEFMKTAEPFIGELPTFLKEN